ncbi:C40 family peptidase [Viridibacillus sp. YIM B01967]|uniref:C40 family peptidase n=1 Tax=Viridibacillus soli TaxID=2798301 RepID=A0ABS1H6N2_9BACL|nr:C40 family peptidase [Viridibacillus soli]MBK3494802.1 C40 family peptidase [Viridibacillus soli]
MNKKALLTAIASSTFALTLTFGSAKAAENDNNTNEETTVEANQVEKPTAIKVKSNFKTTASLNLRTSASTNSKVKTSVAEGTVVSASYKKTIANKTWYLVTVNGKKGWMSGDYLSKTSKKVTKISSNNASGNAIVDQAVKYLGTPYRYGGTTTAGFDCSGFTQYVFQQQGKSITRTSRSQRSETRYTSNPEAGDLVFFNAGGGSITHVAIYMGDGKIVHASGSQVQVQAINNGYWNTILHSYGTFN